MSAWVDLISAVLLCTSKVTIALVRSTIEMPLTEPTLTPAIRTSSPLTSPVASTNSAR